MATKLQSWKRMLGPWKAYRQLKSATLALQCRQRQKIAYSELRDLRVKAKDVGNLKEDNERLKAQVLEMRQKMSSAAESAGNEQVRVAPLVISCFVMIIPSKNSLWSFLIDYTVLDTCNFFASLFLMRFFSLSNFLFFHCLIVYRFGCDMFTPIVRTVILLRLDLVGWGGLPLTLDLDRITHTIHPTGTYPVCSSRFC